MSDSPKNDSPKNTEYLALQLTPVVPDGTPREAAARPQAERTLVEPSLPAGAALWFDDPDTRYVLH